MMKALSFHLFLNFRKGWWWWKRFTVRTEISGMSTELCHAALPGTAGG